jgi:hypothetical protein
MHCVSSLCFRHCRCIGGSLSMVPHTGGVGVWASVPLLASGQGGRVRGVVLRHLELEGQFGAVLTWDLVFIFSWR